MEERLANMEKLIEALQAELKDIHEEIERLQVRTK